MSQIAGQRPPVLGSPGNAARTSTMPPVKQNLFQVCTMPLEVVVVWMVVWVVGFAVAGVVEGTVDAVVEGALECAVS